MIENLLVIAKQPLPGRVKTRLVPPYSHEQAAELAAHALHDTLAAADQVPATHHVLVFDGDPTDWLLPRWEVVQQVEGGLDIRLAAAFASVGSGPAVLVGMDTPQFRADHLRSVGDEGVDAWFGPADDGGFWALGFHNPTCAAELITGVPMSQPDTGARQLARLREAGMSVRILDRLVDVDDWATAQTVAAQAPRTRFAEAVRSMDVRTPQAAR